MAEQAKYILGLQINASSIGWAAIQVSDSNDPVALMRAGVHLFDPGVEGSLLEIKRGRDVSKAVAYRQVKQSQRMRIRRLEREHELYLLLQSCGLLPETPSSSPEQRVLSLNALDRQLEKELNDKLAFTRLPYLLRAAALDRKMRPYELGRIFYHLVQRRGYQSNRRKPEKDGEDGLVKQGISELAGEIAKLQCRTLGEYFAKVDAEKIKVRRRWTSRQMFLDEFEAIWKKQREYYKSLLTDKLKRQIHQLLFFQRPLSSAKHLVGFCEFEPKQRRAPMYCLEAQQFRTLQRVNDMRIVPIGQQEGTPLTKEEKSKLFELMQFNAHLTYSAIKKHFNFPKSSEVNFQRAGEKNLLGNRTFAHHYKVFGERWLSTSSHDRNQAINIWNSALTEQELFTVAMRKYHLSEEQARLWASEMPEAGYCALSKRAIARLMPHMLEGLSYAAAVQREYGEHHSFQPIRREIPPVRDVFPVLSNPAVGRALTQTRKLVNALVRKYERPWEIRIELGNELRRSRKERQTIHSSNRKREASREKFRQRVSAVTGIAVENVSFSDIEKVQLWDECGGICPFTGREIPFDALFRADDWVVTHILPFSRHPDNSFANKTLIYAPEMHDVKRNFTPFEAYGRNEDLYDDILRRVDLFESDMALEKLHRFEVRSRDELEVYTQRTLNDTRFATRWALDLLGTLYGGQEELLPGNLYRRAVFGRPAALTSILRRRWNLNDLWQDFPDDWRGAVLDPIAIACMDEKIFREATQPGKDIKVMSFPWPNFLDSIRPGIENVVPSVCVQQKLNGALHQETHYTEPRNDDRGRSVVTVRKPISSMSLKDIEAIVSKPVREAVLAFYRANKEDLSTCPATGLWPTIPVGKTREVPIRRARIRKALTVQQIGQGMHTRWVANDRNHHMEIFEIEDANGSRYVSRTVSLLESNVRKNKKLPVVDQEMLSLDNIEGRLPKTGKYKWKFVCSLMVGDMVLLHRDCEHDSGTCIPGVYRIRGVATNGQLNVVALNETRSGTDLDKDHDSWAPKIDSLRKLGMIKVKVDLLGEIHPDNGKNSILNMQNLTVEAS